MEDHEVFPQKLVTLVQEIIEVELESSFIWCFWNYKLKGCDWYSPGSEDFQKLFTCRIAWVRYCSFFLVDIGQPMCCLMSKTRLRITFTLYNKAPFITSSNLFYKENRKISHPGNLAWQCKTNQIWRCISLLKMVIFHVVMLVFRGDIWKNSNPLGFR